MVMTTERRDRSVDGASPPVEEDVSLYIVREINKALFERNVDLALAGFAKFIRHHNLSVTNAAITQLGEAAQHSKS